MNSQRITNGALLLIVGLFFLLRNLGIVIDIPWTHLISLWPIFIIIIGLRLIFPRGIFAILAPLLLVLTLVFALISAPVYNGELVTRDFPLTESNQIARLDLDIPIVNLDITSLPLENSNALQVEFRENNISQITSFHGGSRSLFTIKGPAGNSPNRWIKNNQTNPVLARLHSTITWDLHIEAGIARGIIDLRNVEWQNINIKSGIADLTLQFASLNSHDQHLEIEHGIGQVVLQIPPNLNLEIITESPGKLNNFEQLDFVRIGQRYLSPGFQENKPRITAKISGGISRIKAELRP